MTPGRIVIIGAGPCGLACGRELGRLGHEVMDDDIINRAELLALARGNIEHRTLVL